MLRTTSPRRPLSFGLAAAALGLGLALSGCGGGEPAPTTEEPPASSAPAAPSASQPSEPSTAPSEDSSAPSGDGSGEPDAAESPSSDSSEDSGSDGEKPSQEEVASGLAGSIGELVPLPDGSDAILAQLTTCAVEKIYDDASDDSLRAMADGQLDQADADDLNALSTAISECSSEVTG